MVPVRPLLQRSCSIRCLPTSDRRRSKARSILTCSQRLTLGTKGHGTAKTATSWYSSRRVGETHSAFKTLVDWSRSLQPRGTVKMRAPEQGTRRTEVGLVQHADRSHRIGRRPFRLDTPGSNVAQATSLVSSAK